MFYFIIFLIIAYLIFLLIPKSAGKKKHQKVGQEFDHEELYNRKKHVVTIDFPKSDNETGKYLVVDVETTGLPKSRYAPIEDSKNWPYILQIAWILLDEQFKEVSVQNYYIAFDGYIPYEAQRIHNIDNDLLKQKGFPASDVFNHFLNDADRAEYIVAHNIDFDLPIIRAELARNYEFENNLGDMKTICTMKAAKAFVNVYDRSGRLKNPKLTELYGACYHGSPYGISFGKFHNAYDDVMITAHCLMYLVNEGIINQNHKTKKKSIKKLDN